MIKINKIKLLFDLFITFAKVGVVTFGGGYAMLPILQREVAAKKKWTTEEELTDYYAIGQCTPGIIAVNTATFVGYKNAGILGGIFATLGLAFPSIVIIEIIAAFITNFTDNPMVGHAFAGIRVAVCSLVLIAVLKLAKSAIKNKITGIIFALVLVISLLTNISPVILVVISGIVGMIFFTEKKKDDENNKGEK